MEISVLCNAGLALTYEGATLLVDVLNGTVEPFCTLKEEIWQGIFKHEPPYENICGLYFTHDHPDHYDKDKLQAYLKSWPETPVSLPDGKMRQEAISIGPFMIDYSFLEHAPMNEETPPHVITWICAGEESIYISADAKLDTAAHRLFLNGRKADYGFWNSMYLSQPQTRQLLKDAAKQNYIYHMPEQNPDGFGLWRKCEKNFQRYGSELDTVTVIHQYPYRVK